MTGTRQVWGKEERGGGATLKEVMSVVDVFVAGDVVFSKIGSDLHLDQAHGQLALVGKPVNGTQGHENRAALAYKLLSSPIVTVAVPSTTIQCSMR